MRRARTVGLKSPSNRSPVEGISDRFRLMGALSPLWSRDGTEILYRNGNQMMVVAVETDAVYRRRGRRCYLTVNTNGCRGTSETMTSAPMASGSS